MSVVYQSASSNLLEDTGVVQYFNNSYLLDRQTNQHELIGSAAIAPDISASGRYITFTSEVNQPNGGIEFNVSQVFLYDRNGGIYIQIDEGIFPRVNDNGQVIFLSIKAISNADLNGAFDAYLFDPSDSSIALVSTGMGGFASSANVANISGSSANSWVVFTSSADDVVINDTNDAFDVFMKQIPGGSVFRVSETAAGVEGNNFSIGAEISENGEFVVFESYADNLTANDYSEAGSSQILYYDRLNDLIKLASKNELNQPIAGDIFRTPSISDSGRYIAYLNRDWITSDFAIDSDQKPDVVVFDT